MGTEGYCANVTFFVVVFLNPVDDCVTVSVNCHSLGNMQKRKEVFHYLRNKKYSIGFFCKTPICSPKWKLSFNSQGVAVSGQKQRENINFITY